MEILKCNAEYNKVYYVEIEKVLYQCKLIGTEIGVRSPLYVLDVAKKGIVKIETNNRHRYFDQWYRNSTIPSILYESVEDYRNGKPIIDNYGSTNNCYNAPFIDKLFKHHKPCNCGGSIITWKWDGCKAVQYIVNMNSVCWYWDSNGFHCNLNDEQGCYRTKEECLKKNEISVVTF